MNALRQLPARLVMAAVLAASSAVLSSAHAGILLGEGSILPEDDGILLGEDGILREANGILLGEDGLLHGLDGILLGEDGILLGVNGILLGEDGILLGQDGILLGQDGILLGQDGILLGDVGLYIVQFDPSSVEDTTVAEATARVLQMVGAGPAMYVYDTVLTGFSAPLSAAQAQVLEELPAIKSVELDRIVSVGAEQAAPVYGLDRIDESDNPTDGVYAYPNSAGAGVHVYVIDTGINPNHSEFSGRVGSGQNFVYDGPLGIGGVLPVDAFGLVGLGEADPDAWDDCHGHGTHVAGTAAGTTYGVAKQATVHAVRVLNCGGSGSGSGVIAGMEWVAENAEYPAVVNMSLGGGTSDAEDAAIQALFDLNIVAAVAAGNDDTDACTTSPARAPAALTVASSDASDAESSFSNHGTCVDIYAPGSSIRSADYANDSGSTVMSGTSMASPHVAGGVALLLGETPELTATAVTTAIVGNASVGKIAQSPANAGTPNFLLNVYPEAAKR